MSTMHASVKAMREEWWSADARKAFTEVADAMVAAGIPADQVMVWLARLYTAAARDEAEGGAGVRVEAISLRKMPVETQIDTNEETGAAVLAQVPTIDLRVRVNGGWKALFRQAVDDMPEKVSEMWDAEAIGG